MTIKDVFGTLLIITSIFDALKYTIQARKIHKAKSAKHMSRKFTNWAISNDLVKLGYGCIINDLYIINSCLLALVCMLHLWYETYWWYPYRNRGLRNFKRPNIIVYFINSLALNRLRRHL